MSEPSRSTVTIDRDGVELAVHLVGADGPPVLALHGLASNAHANWMLSGWARALTDAGYRVVAPDLRGHGLSAHPHDEAAYRSSVLIDDIVAVLDTLDLECVDALGYSLGASLAWVFALVHPERIRTLNLGGFALGPPFAGVDTSGIQRRLVGPERTANLRTAVISDIVAASANDDRAALSALVEGMRADWAYEGQPSARTLVVAGADDVIASGRARVAEELPAARYVRVPSRNHVTTVTARAFKQSVLENIAAADDRPELSTTSRLRE